MPLPDFFGEADVRAGPEVFAAAACFKTREVSLTADFLERAEVLAAADDFGTADFFEPADVFALEFGRRFFAGGMVDGIGRTSDGEGIRPGARIRPTSRRRKSPAR